MPARRKAETSVAHVFDSAGAEVKLSDDFLVARALERQVSRLADRGESL